MFESLLWALYLQIPVVIGGVLHMVAVRLDIWPVLARPLSRRLFGANKTWRGFVLVPLFTTLGALPLLSVEWALGPEALLGPVWLLPAAALAGLGYMLGELPNSWLKRRLGIAAGATPARGRQLFMALDQLDSALGVALVYACWPGISAGIVLAYVLSFPLTALAVKRLLFMASLKSSPA